MTSVKCYLSGKLFRHSKVFTGTWSHGPLQAGTYQNSKPPKRKVFGVNHVVRTHIEPLFSVVGMMGAFPKSKFPDAN